MKNEYTFDEASENEAMYTNKTPDFMENDNSSTESKTTIDPTKEIRHRKIKCGIFNTLISAGINAIPIVTEMVKNKKNGVPNKINKIDVVKFAVSTAFPVLETVDAAFLNDKLSDKFHLKDVRNVTNIVMTYPAAHRALNDFVKKTVNANNGQAVVEEKTDATARTWLGVANLVTPYVTDKMTNKDLSIGQKFKSVLPVPILGRLIRVATRNNPELQKVYDSGTDLIRFASSASHSIGNMGAVRSKPNSIVSKSASTVSNIADTLGEFVGISRGRYGFNGYGNNFNGGFNNGYGSSYWG